MIDSDRSETSVDLLYRLLEVSRSGCSQGTFGAGLIFHSDRGIQYAAGDYRDALKRHDIFQSMSRKGDSYDNAVAENFFSCLKCELVYLQHFTTRAAAKAALFWYIETFYNSVRPHSALGWVAPNPLEKDWRLAAAASAIKVAVIR